MVVRREFKKVVAEIGLGDWTPNELRHSTASLMSDAGKPIYQVADQLGTRTYEGAFALTVRVLVVACSAGPSSPSCVSVVRWVPVAAGRDSAGGP